MLGRFCRGLECVQSKEDGIEFVGHVERLMSLERGDNFDRMEWLK